MEKSCGAVIYRKKENKLEYLTVQSKAYGHWGFPKGHIEEGETEKETAQREVAEEVGLHINIDHDFRAKIEYTLSNGTKKEVIYFTGDATGQHVTIQEDEIQDFKWCDYEDMIKLLTFENDRNILHQAHFFLQTAGC